MTKEIEIGYTKKVVKKIKMERHICNKCNHSWLKRFEKKPKPCPHCKSKHWDKRDKENK
jgi:rubrerythrin